MGFSSFADCLEPTKHRMNSSIKNIAILCKLCSAGHSSSKLFNCVQSICYSLIVDKIVYYENEIPQFGEYPLITSFCYVTLVSLYLF